MATVEPTPRTQADGSERRCPRTMLVHPSPGTGKSLEKGKDQQQIA